MGPRGHGGWVSHSLEVSPGEASALEGCMEDTGFPVGREVGKVVG